MSTLDPDIRVESERLVLSESLETAIKMSLLCRARARPDDPVEGREDLQGWWADSLAEVPGDSFGSRLWVLQGLPMPQCLELAPDMCRDALQWLLDEGLLTAIEIEVEAVASDRLGIQVTIAEPDPAVVVRDVFVQISVV